MGSGDPFVFVTSPRVIPDRRSPRSGLATQPWLCKLSVRLRTCGAPHTSPNISHLPRLKPWTLPPSLSIILFIFLCLPVSLCLHIFFSSLSFPFFGPRVHCSFTRTPPSAFNLSRQFQEGWAVRLLPTGGSRLLLLSINAAQHQHRMAPSAYRSSLRV